MANFTHDYSDILRKVIIIDYSSLNSATFIFLIISVVLTVFFAFSLSGIINKIKHNFSSMINSKREQQDKLHYTFKNIDNIKNIAISKKDRKVTRDKPLKVIFAQNDPMGTFIRYVNREYMLSMYSSYRVGTHLINGVSYTCILVGDDAGSERVPLFCRASSRHYFQNRFGITEFIPAGRSGPSGSVIIPTDRSNVTSFYIYPSPSTERIDNYRRYI